jgi:hypothetical protein
MCTDHHRSTVGPSHPETLDDNVIGIRLKKQLVAKGFTSCATTTPTMSPFRNQLLDHLAIDSIGLSSTDKNTLIRHSERMSREANMSRTWIYSGSQPYWPAEEPTSVVLVNNGPQANSAQGIAEGPWMIS